MKTLGIILAVVLTPFTALIDLYLFAWIFTGRPALTDVLWGALMPEFKRRPRRDVDHYPLRVRVIIGICVCLLTAGVFWALFLANRRLLHPSTP